MTLDPRRINNFGGSDMYILMGAAPESWGTPRDVIGSKLNLTPTRDPSVRMEVGTALEDFMFEKYQALHGQDLEPSLMRLQKFAEKPEFHLCGTADFVYEDPDEPFGVDWKTTTGEWERVPDHYVIQAQTYMIVFGVKRWDIFSLHDFRTFAEPWILEANKNIQDAIKECAAYYAGFVHRGILPTPEEYWRRPDPPELPSGTAPMTDEILEPTERYIILGEQIEEIKKIREQVKETIIPLMNNAKKIENPIYRINRSYVQPKPDIDWEAVATWLMQQHPDDYGRVIDANRKFKSPYWRFSADRR